MKLFLFIALLLFAIWDLFITEKSVVLEPGIRAPSIPIQIKIDPSVPFQFKDYTIHPAAFFDLTAKILSKERYTSGRDAELSPIDFAMGWGAMSDQSIVDKIEISQSNRWYYWRVDEPPIPNREIETHSSNMHMIPANEAIKSEIVDAKVGNIVHLKGKLVRITASDGFYWNSSLTRDDTGDGACEVVFVESFSVIE
jgi:hypothetical protein